LVWDKENSPNRGDETIKWVAVKAVFDFILHILEWGERADHQLPPSYPARSLSR
jgi:hypothetical protein